MSDALPFVSVVMPVRNEARFIAHTLGGVLAQDYPVDRLEILVADGMSDDGTREILAELAKEHPQLVVIDNPGRIVSTGLNAAIARARGEIIIRIDGHAEIATDFIRRDVELLAAHPEAWIVGGPIIHGGKNALGRAIAVAMSHRLGVGNADFRFESFEGYATSAQFPAFRRWVFDRVGNFDEQLVRNQDDELNYRVIQAGGKILISRQVRYVYYVRERFDQLFRQYFQYAFWRIPMIRKHRRPTTVRQTIPALFYLLVLALLLIGIWQRSWVVALALPAVYATVLLGAGLALVPRLGFGVAMRVPLAIAVMHAGQGFGMIYGLISQALGRDAWNAGGAMAKLSR